MASYSDTGSYRINTRSRVWQRIDLWLVLATLILIAFGLLALYSHGTHPGSGAYFKKQVFNITVGLIPAAIMATVPPRAWLRLAPLLYVVNLIGLVAIFKIGAFRNGSARWIEVGPIQFQPSEMAKLVLILTLASFYAMRHDKLKDASTFLLGFLHMAVPAVLILKQPHFGGAMVLLVIWLAISMIAQIPARFLIVTGIVSCLGVLMLIAFSGDFHGKRIKAFLPPAVEQGIGHIFGIDSTPPPDTGKGMTAAARAAKTAEQGILYQTNQARTAFGVGGVVGTGFGKGEQGELIPEQQTDFIFTVIGEELGLVGCTLVLCAFAFLFYRIWLIMFHATEPYYRMLVGGVLAMLAFHTFVNLFMVTQMLPVIGLWLPFMSYGGTAMWLCMSGIALVLNIRSRAQPILF
jgi:rod shape determining protein RodA